MRKINAVKNAEKMKVDQISIKEIYNALLKMNKINIKQLNNQLL